MENDDFKTPVSPKKGVVGRGELSMWFQPGIYAKEPPATSPPAAYLLSYNEIHPLRGIYYDFHILVKKCLDMICVCRYIDNRLLNLEMGYALL